MFEELFEHRGLSLERLHALLRLSDEGSLIRAARGDPGLQSRYSHYLKELAGYFGVELTERVGKSMRLTPAGDKLVRLVRQQFQALLQLRDGLRGTASAFSVGAGDSLLQWLVIPTVAALRRPKSNIRFSLHNLGVDEIVSRLHDQRLDFGLVTHDALLRGLAAKPICRVQHLIVVPDRVSTRRGMLTLRDALLECPHASSTGDDAMRQALDRIARELGAPFEPELQCESVSHCVAAVRTGQYAAVLPRWAWDTGVRLPHAICEDPKLDSLDQKLMLAWHPRLMQTRGSLAQNVMTSLVARLGDSAITA